MRQPVRFIQSIQVAHQLGARVFLEMGPDAQLVACGQREYRDNAYWIASARRNKEASDVLNQALLQLYAAGVALPWADLLAGDGQRIAAPCYPFDTERYWKERVSPACEPADAALSAGLEVASRAATALDLPRLEALKQCATRLHAIYVDQLVQRCTGDAIENGVDAMTIMRRGRLLPRYQQLLQRLLNNCVVDGDYRCTDGRYVRARPIEHQQRESLLTELAGYCEGFQAIPDTIARAGDRLYEMMSGAEEPVAIIFPQSASDGVEVLYQNSALAAISTKSPPGYYAALSRRVSPASRCVFLKLAAEPAAPPRGCCRNSTAFRHWSTISPISRRCSPVAPSRNSPTTIL